MRQRYPNHTNRRLMAITRCGLALLVAGAAMTGCAGDGEPEGVAVTTTTPTSEPNPVLAIPQTDSPLVAGTYLISAQGRGGSDPIVWSIVDFTVTLPSGLVGHTGHYVSKNEEVEGASGYGFYPVLVDEVYADPCLGESGPTATVGPEPDDLVDALVAQPGTTTTVTHTTIGGYPATRVDLEIADDVDLKSCFLFEFGPPGGLQIWFSEPSDKYLVSMPDLVSSIYVVDINGQRQVFMAGVSSDASDEDLAELQSIVDSIHIL
jgi:hypothetical protein